MGAPERVPKAQAQARRSLGVGALFIVAAVVTAVVDTGEGRWVPLHLFLAGAMASIIGGITTLFAVTWSAAPAPSAASMWVQRVLVAAGATGVVLARSLDWPSEVLWAAAAVFMVGLGLLAVVLVVTVRAGVKRRFDTAVGWYVAALAAALVAAVLGSRFSTAATGIGVRSAHVTLNLLGFIGLIIAGTLPSFIATVGRTKMSPRSNEAALRWLLLLQAGAVTVAAVGFVTDRRPLAVAGLLAYAVGLGFLARRLPAPRQRSLDWAGPRLLALWAGLAWWTAAVVVAAVDVADERLPFADHWTLILVVVAFGQILWGSLAYLLPVLRAGGHQMLTQGFRALRSWLGLAAVNLAGLAWVAGLDAVASVAVGVWLVDAGVRGVMFARGRLPVTSPEPKSKRTE